MPGTAGGPWDTMEDDLGQREKAQDTNLAGERKPFPIAASHGWLCTHGREGGCRIPRETSSTQGIPLEEVEMEGKQRDTEGRKKKENDTIKLTAANRKLNIFKNCPRLKVNKVI